MFNLRFHARLGELVCVRTTGCVWECRRHVGGKVGSKLQKKLIKNEKRQRREDGSEERGGPEWTEAAEEEEGGRKTGRKRRGRYERRKAVFY